MSADVFEELLHEFRELWTRSSDIPGFDLAWHNLSGCQMLLTGDPFSGKAPIAEWMGHSKEDPPFDLGAREVVARLSLPYDDAGTRSTLGFDVVTLPKADAFAEVSREFQALSARAGAALPPEIKELLTGYVYELNDDSAAWWYALLFWMNGERVAYHVSEQVGHRHEITVGRPLLASTYAIEKLGLNKWQETGGDVARGDAANRDGRSEPISVLQADATARVLAAENAAFTDLTAREWAEKIREVTGKTCSLPTITSTSLWKETMAKTGRGRSKGKTPRAVGLTEKAESVIGDRRPGDVLEQLAADEEYEAGQEETAELAAAIEAVEASGMKDEQKAATLEKLNRGELTAEKAKQLASMFTPKVKRTGPVKRFRTV